MYSITGTSIALTKGDTFKCEITIYQDGTEYELQQGDVVRFAMKKNYASADVLITKELPSTLLLTLAPEDTKNLAVGDYVYDIELTTAGGDVDTFIKGTLTLEPEVC